MLLLVQWNISELDTQDYTWSTGSFTSNYIHLADAFIQIDLH